MKKIVHLKSFLITYSKSSLHAGQGSGRIDVVFDVYRNQSIKHAERVSRGS